MPSQGDELLAHQHGENLLAGSVRPRIPTPATIRTRPRSIWYPKFCVTTVPQTNLRLEKTVSEKGCTRGDNFECHYNVKVINAAPGDYNDKIVVNEFIPIGTTVTGDWNCVTGAARIIQFCLSRVRASFLASRSTYPTDWQRS